MPTVITTTPFDAPTSLPTEASRRNARNTQHILAEERHLAQVVDPAGRSCYIEWYSNEVHIMGRQMMDGIGGSGDFTRNAYISIFTYPSNQRGGKISTIVPMVSHMDHSMHSVQVLATEHGVADLRGKNPSARARMIVAHCPAPEYRDHLKAYLAVARIAAVVPLVLRDPPQV